MSAYIAEIAAVPQTNTLAWDRKTEKWHLLPSVEPNFFLWISWLHVLALGSSTGSQIIYSSLIALSTLSCVCFLSCPTPAWFCCERWSYFPWVITKTLKFWHWRSPSKSCYWGKWRKICKSILWFYYFILPEQLWLLLFIMNLKTDVILEKHT